MKEINIIGLYPVLARAAEISLSSTYASGPHGISLYRYVGSDPALAVSDSHMKLVMQAFKMTPRRDGDLQIEIGRPKFDELRLERVSETLNDIYSRVHKNVRLPDPSEEEQACLDLVKVAYDRLDMDVHDYLTIWKVAKTIARMAQSKRIEPEHVAEAIQYRTVRNQVEYQIWVPNGN